MSKPGELVFLPVAVWRLKVWSIDGQDSFSETP
jgi:hypothetical protein